MAGKLAGTVVSIDETGSAVTDITADQLADVPRDEQVQVQCEGHKTICIFPHDHGQDEMTYIACLADSGELKLMLVGDSVRDFLGIRPGSKVVVKW